MSSACRSKRMCKNMPEKPRHSSTSYSKSEKSSDRRSFGRYPTKSGTASRSEESRSRTDRRDRPGGRTNDRRPRDRANQPVLEGELIYGRNAVVETIRGKREIFRVIVASGIREDERIKGILDESKRRGIEIERIEREALDFLTNTTHHQGIALVVGS